MPELDPKDLRRLKVLEERFAKTREEAKDLVEERRTLLQRLNQSEARCKAAEKSVELLQKGMDELRQETQERLRLAERKVQEAEARPSANPEQIASLIEENRRLAENFEAASSDLQRFSETAIQLRQDLGAARADLEKTEATHQVVAAQLQKTEEDRTGLASRLELATRQLATQGKTPILPATEVARLTNELVDRLRGGFGDLRVRDGELKLKVAFAGVGDKTGLVVPTLDSDPKLKDSLQELTVRFDRAGLAENR